MPFFPVINIRVTIATLSPSLTVDFCFSTIYSNSRGGSMVLGLGADGVGGDGVEGGHTLGWWVGVAARVHVSAFHFATRAAKTQLLPLRT